MFSIFKKKDIRGIADFGRPKQIENLYNVRELVYAPAGVSLANTDPDRWRIYKLRDQRQQNSCVFQARAKAAGILAEQYTGEFIEFSAEGYNRRSNLTVGSFPIESMDMWHTDGIVLETLTPSIGLQNDAELKKMRNTEFDTKVAKISTLDAYYSLQPYNFDLILSTLHSTNKPIPLGFFATQSEWYRDIPTILEPRLTIGSAVVRHEVCATPNFGIWNGEEGFTIEDSLGKTGIEGTGVRWITRSFFQRRNYIPGLVPTRFKNYGEMNIDPARPHIKLTRDLQRDMIGPDVRELQQVLKFEGFFPANHSGSEYYGPITERGVKQYQAKHGIVNEGTPITTGYGRVGPQTRAHINNRYR
jgi:hypothetical protein